MDTKICVFTDNIDYNKKFCSVANKLYKNKMIFIYFNDLKSLQEYINDKENSTIIVDEKVYDDFRNININTTNSKIITLTENKSLIKDNNYIYKYQNINNLLNCIVENIGTDQILNINNKKVIVYINIDQNKTNENIVKKIIKNISKKTNTLYINLLDFENYKNNHGISNIIYQYKNDKLNIDTIAYEIEDKINNTINVDVLHSVSFPEDFNVINSLDMLSIFEMIYKLEYEIFFINVDFNFTKIQYLLNNINYILFNNKNNIYINVLKNHIKDDYSIDNDKIIEIKIDENNKIDIKKILSNINYEK